MEKLKVQQVIGRFFNICDPEDIRTSVRDMYKSLMMSECDLTIEERQRFTLACKQVEDLLYDLKAARKENE